MIRSGDFVKLKDRPVGYFMPLDIEFQVQYLTDNGKRAYITNNDMALEISVELLVLLDDKGENVVDKKENNIVYFTDNKLKIQSEFGAVIEIQNYLGQNNKMLLKLFGNDKCYDKYYADLIFEKISDINNFIRILGFKQVIKRAETVAEIIENMKKISKPFEQKKEQYSVYINYEQKKVYVISSSTYDNVGTLYFDYDIAEDFVKRLQMAYDREEWK